MSMTLTKILGDDGSSLVIRIDINQMQTSQIYSHVSILLFISLDVI